MSKQAPVSTDGENSRTQRQKSRGGEVETNSSGRPKSNMLVVNTLQRMSTLLGFCDTSIRMYGQQYPLAMTPITVCRVRVPDVRCSSRLVRSRMFRHGRFSRSMSRSRE